MQSRLQSRVIKMSNNVLFIDNFDSFTYNLVDEFEKLGCDITIFRNNISMDIIDNFVKTHKPKLIVISPGPSTPEKAGNSISIIKKYHKTIPIFGVCLGHQAIITAFGGKVSKADEIVHGKASKILHDNKTIYNGIENPFLAARYHSLTGIKIPDCLEISAKHNNLVMGVRHKQYFVEGVQFHPESILTPTGSLILKNLVEAVK